MMGLEGNQKDNAAANITATANAKYQIPYARNPMTQYQANVNATANAWSSCTGCH